MMSTVMKTDKVNDLYEKYAGVKSDTETAKVDTEAKVETKTEEVKDEQNRTEAISSDDSKPSDTVKEKTETKPVAEETKTEERPEKKTYTHQEQVDYAFQKLKAKNKKLAERIKQLEEENKKKPNKTLEDFNGNVEQYSDYRTDRKIAEYEKKRLEDEYRASQAEEYDTVNNKKISNCFPDAVEQEKYRELVSREGANLLAKLDKDDPESAILGFLDDSEISPILIRIFMTDPQYLDNVLAKRSPYGKYREMEKLAERVEYAREQLSKKKSEEKVETETKPEVKPQIPVIGSVTKSEQHKDSKQVFDPNEILHKLKSKNKYHK